MVEAGNNRVNFQGILPKCSTRYQSSPRYLTLYHQTPLRYPLRMRTYLFLFALLTSLPVQAELYNCNGTWTNNPCAGKVVSRLPEQKEAQRSQAQVDRSQKDLWLEALDLRRSDLKRRYRITADIYEARTVCKNDTSTVLECSKAVEKKQREFDEREEAAKLLF